MKRQRNFILLAILFAMTLGILSTTGCKKDEDPPTTPAIPPQAGFVMNFNDFSSAGDTLKSTAQTDTYLNWGYSYLNVAIWNSVLTVGLAIPVASFAEAFNHEAIYHPDNNNWTWSYNFNVGFTAYEAELTGAYVADSTSWEMRITKAGEYADFLWYTGKASVTQTGGYWILKENPQTPGNLLRIDWNKYTDGTSDIKYTNIKSNIPENGSYIYYGSTLDVFNRFYQIYHKNLNNTTTIEWSSTLKNGHVKDPAHFNDISWHCWDYTLQDVICP
ncbi:MAG: hypothetical protein IPH84_16155 [Bacteroidales bacterium]|nr:hypothetical protein [Bacteroidales bacterium]